MNVRTVWDRARATSLLPWVAAVLCVLLVLGMQECRVRRAQRAAGATALAADTLRAHFDTTRAAVTGKDSARILGDSLRAVQRLVVQVKQDRDALDKAMGLQRIAMQQLTAQVQQLVATVSSSQPTVEAADGTRSAHFDVRQEPYTVSADVRLPTPPGRGDMAVRVTLDPATINMRLGCAPANERGIRSATATATGPPWLPITLGRVEQDPSLCASPALATGPGRWAGLRRWLPHPSVGWGLTQVGDGTVRTGWQLGAHIDLWRP